MQLVVALVAATAVVVSEASARTSLEAARQCVEDRATAAQTATAAAASEQDSLTSRLAPLRPRSRSSVRSRRLLKRPRRGPRPTTATKIVAQDAAQAATREMATLEARVLEVERDLGMATMDLATAGR
jgi:hypothetical protein